MADRRRSKNSGPGASIGVPEDVPPDVVAQAKAAFGRRSGGALAALVFDSLVDGAPSAEHRLRFEHPQERVEVRVQHTNGESTLQGRADPAPLRVELELEGTDVALVESGSSGDFTFHHVPPGLKRMILVGPPGSEPVWTDWFRT